MTAAELIERLKTLPPESIILVEGYETGYDDIVEITPEQVVWYRNARDWDGEYQAPERFSNSATKAVQASGIRGLRGNKR